MTGKRRRISSGSAWIVARQAIAFYAALA